MTYGLSLCWDLGTCLQCFVQLMIPEQDYITICRFERSLFYRKINEKPKMSQRFYDFHVLFLYKNPFNTSVFVDHLGVDLHLNLDVFIIKLRSRDGLLWHVFL